MESYFGLAFGWLALCLLLGLGFEADCRNFLSESFLDRVELPIFDSLRGVRSCLAVISILDTDL